MLTQSVTAETEAGMLEGVFIRDGISVFRGVPYARPPIGELRWRKPMPVERWSGIRPATEFPCVCPQAPQLAFFQNEFYQNFHPEQSEDCLYLNIWTPDVHGSCPVIAFFHGGAYVAGCSFSPEIDGVKFAEHEIVLVTVDYRLGLLGFGAHETIECNGNLGLFDAVEALKWMHRNIHNFGGDPSNITIMGQSAGAMLCQCLIESPMTDGLFERAILMSGGGYTSLGVFDRTLADAQKKTAGALTKLGIKSRGDAELLPTEKIIEVCQSMKVMEYTPCIDGELIKATHCQTIDSGNYKDIPILIGCLSKEFGWFSNRCFYRLALNQCRAQLTHHKTPAYLYYGTFDMFGKDKPGSFHAADLLYVFGTYKTNWRPKDPSDESLSDAFVKYWSAFAKTGNPNCEGLPEWEPYTESKHVHLEIGRQEIALKPAFRF